jgi:acyl dehydratase
MRFSEFAPGMVITAGLYEVSEAEVLQFAKAWDPQWFHTDPVAAMNSRFGGLIASAWHTCGIAMRLMADKALQGSESFAWPGLHQVATPRSACPQRWKSVLPTMRCNFPPTFELKPSHEQASLRLHL